MQFTSTLKTIIGLSMFLPYSVIAADSHVHGEANVYIVANKQQLMIELETPAANILGFEHAPRTPEQLQILKSAKVMLQDYSNIVHFGNDFNCKIQRVDLDAPFGDEEKAHPDDSTHHSAHNSEHHESEHQSEHSSAHNSEHHESEHQSEHNDHNSSHNDEHHGKDHGDDHKGHNDQHEQHTDTHADTHADSADNGHSDFHVTYELTCATKPIIKQADITGFTTFPGIEKIQVHWVNGSKQGAFEATANNYSVEF